MFHLRVVNIYFPFIKTTQFLIDIHFLKILKFLYKNYQFRTFYPIKMVIHFLFIYFYLYITIYIYKLNIRLKIKI